MAESGPNNNITGRSSNVAAAEPENLATRIALGVYEGLVCLVTIIAYILQAIYYTAVGLPKKSLHGELALVTGGGSGIGRLTAIKLAKLGVSIVIWDVNQEGIDETVRMVRANGGKCVGYKVDISKREDVYNAADIVRRDVGSITLLVNNAGVVSGRALLDTPDHLIERTMLVNTVAHFWTTKAFLPEMLEKDHGHIVTIASLAGHIGVGKLIDYCASKFAAVGFDESLRSELLALDSKIQTTCICPYFINSTGMFNDVNATSGQIPTLSSESVSDRIVTAIQCNERIVIIPGYLKYLLSFKYLLPLECTNELMKRIVPDGCPSHDVQSGMPLKKEILNKEKGA